jgi:hypothetical protein
MRQYIILVSFIFATFFLNSCENDKISLGGHILFMADGPEIKYASCPTGGKPRFRSISAMKHLAAAGSIEIVDIVPLNEEHLLVITRQHGLYHISSRGGVCSRIDRGLPPEVVYPFTSNGFTKPVIQHSIAADKKRIAVVVPSDVYLSTDGGSTFARLPLAGVRRHTELISVALHPVNERLMVIGTSSNGIYYSKDGGRTVRRIKSGIPGEPVHSPNFLEEIRSLCFGDGADVFYAGLGNGNGVYRGIISRGLFEKINDPALVTYPDGDFYRVTNVNYFKGNLFIGTNRNWRKILSVDHANKGHPANGTVRDYFLKQGHVISAHTEGVHLSFPNQYVPKRDFKPDRRALNRRALYISYSFTQKENYPRLINLLRHLKLNAVVINLKDDYGSIRVPVSDRRITQVPGSVNPYVNVMETIQRLKGDGIYVIGRQVCFKDDKVYAFRNGAYAVKNSAGHPFRKGPEKWVDGFSEFVWDYNIAVAIGIEKAGVDEIQFDYIRFPDVRGENDNRRFDYKREHQTMREALASFLKKARAAVTVPLSIDLFGYNAIYQWGEWIGQDVSELSRYVDVVSGMFYPSHYTGGYAAGYGTRRIYYTVYLSCKRSRELSGGAHQRPYIQAFYYKDNSDGYCVDYIGWELDGIKDSGIKDYIFWNDLSEYTILIRGLRKYHGMGEGPVPPELKANIPRKLPFNTIVEKKDSPEAI